MRSTYLPLLASGLAIALISIAHLSMSLPEDELGPGVSRATLVRRRLHSRYAHLERRLHSLVSLRRELQDSVTEQQKQAAAAVAAAALQPRGNHTSNGSSVVEVHDTKAHAAALAATSAASTAAVAAATAPRRARRGSRRPAPVAASPPPSTGPPLLLRPGREAACLAHDAPLEALTRATCSLAEARQQFVFEARSATLRYAADSTQCVDYLAGLEAFGVWSCLDAANAHFARSEARSKSVSQ